LPTGPAFGFLLAPSERVKIEVRARPEVPGVRATYFDADERLWCSVKDRFSVSLIYSGRSEWWSRGRTLSSGPRTID
jgi:hypothetical protein